ncbi:MAG: hypothetical protein JWP02_3839 [Acidimicrobiales bacterium]|nr:hypothetical protein [Acidimicrobiales bacterium]
MIEDQSGIRHLATKAARHVRWARSDGLARLAEEDDLRPVVRASRAFQKWRWRRTHAVEIGTAAPVWLVGVQRSGTNMVVRGLEASPEVEVHNENDGKAFERFRLRPDPAVRDLVLRSRHRYVLFKPLCDSHRIDDLLALDTPTPGRAIWAYRGVDGRVRSALAKFGDTNLRVLTDIAAGRGLDRWQAQRLSGESLELIRSFDWSAMSPASGAAFFWYVRNILFFELGLDRRADVLLAGYDALVADPAAGTRALASFLGLAWHPGLAAHIERRDAPTPPPLDLDARVRQRCQELQERLDGLAALPAT